MNTPTQYILVGYPFSGKTTLSKQLENTMGFGRVCIDEIKFRKGYEGMSDDDVPAAVWKNIFEESYKQVLQILRSGKSVANCTAWITKEWRQKARKIATDAGFPTKVIFIDIPVDVVRERYYINKSTNDRFDLPDNIFEEAIRDFEKPTADEDVIVFDQSIPAGQWIKENFK